MDGISEDKRFPALLVFLGMRIEPQKSAKRHDNEEMNFLT